MDNMDRESRYLESGDDGGHREVGWSKLLGASLIGGAVTGIAYYFYSQMSERQKKEIMNMLFSNGKPMLVKYLTKDE